MFSPRHYCFNPKNVDLWVKLQDGTYVYPCKQRRFERMKVFKSKIEHWKCSMGQIAGFDVVISEINTNLLRV